MTNREQARLMTAAIGTRLNTYQLWQAAEDVRLLLAAFLDAEVRVEELEAEVAVLKAQRHDAVDHVHNVCPCEHRRECRQG